MRNTIIIFLFALLFTLIPQESYAQEKASGSSASLVIDTQFTAEKDSRVEQLETFLSAHNSPMVGSAKTFIEEADKNNLDWKLVASIAGVESYFGKLIPYGSYNGWGWGVYGNNVIMFPSWDEAIKTISQSLREKYIDKWGASDVYTIGRFYAADPNWANKVSSFMNKIERFDHKDELASLSISL